MNKFRHIAGQFLDPSGNPEITPISNGLINDTYLIKNSGWNEKYVLQKINQQVFPEPDKVMDNLICIVNHLANRPDPRYQLLKLIKTITNDDYYVDTQKDYWRLFEYLENTSTIDQITDPVQALEASRAFGNFIRRLNDLETQEVKETIKDFHNYQSRIIKLNEAARKDEMSRKIHCREELDFIEKRLPYINKFYSLSLPIRIIHSDTKIDNILFDRQLERAVCVIDLDIAMPGSVLYDYGDMVRSYTNKVKEDDPDLSLIELEHDILYYLTRGFLEETMSLLTKQEIKNLILGAKIVILLQAIRNLTDFLMGDVYYKINYETHNLVRAQNQLKLLNCVEKDEKKFQNMINSIIRNMK